MMLCSLHWLPVAPCICFKTLVLVYHAVNGSGPVYIQVMVKPYTSARPLCSASANRLVAPSLRASHSTKSQLFAVLAPKWWNELPIDIRTAEVKPRTRQVLLWQRRESDQREESSLERQACVALILVSMLMPVNSVGEYWTEPRRLLWHCRRKLWEKRFQKVPTAQMSLLKDFKLTQSTFSSSCKDTWVSIQHLTVSVTLWSRSPGVKVHVCRYKTLRNIQNKPRLYFQGSFL